MSQEARIARHYELWQRESASVGRWVMGSLLFAAVVLLRVIEPYVATSLTLAREQAALTAQTGDQAHQRQELERTERLSKGVAGLYANIRGSPWQAPVDELKQDLERLGAAYRTLSDAGPTALADTLTLRPELPDHAGASPFEQVAPRPLPGAGRRDALRSDSLTPHAAAELLSIDTGTIGDLSATGFAALLRERLAAAAEALADATVGEISSLVDDNVVSPLDELVRNAGGTELARTLVPIVEALQAAMADWTRSLIDDPEWYLTAQRKDSVVRGLDEALRQYQVDFGRAYVAARKRLSESIGVGQERMRQIEARMAALDKTTRELAEVLKQALPGWIRDLVSPMQMIQLYPATLVFLILAIASKAGATRRHYLIARDHRYPDGAHREDGALSSTWTLAYRGPSGTAVTAIALTGCALVLLWHFDRGTAAALAWIGDHPEAAWPRAGPWLERLRPFGWIVCVGAAGAAVLALVADFRAGRRA